MPKPKKKNPDRSPILPDVLYPLKTFQMVSGLGEYALGRAHDKGLKYRHVGARVFILGADFIAFTEQQTRETKSA